MSELTIEQIKKAQELLNSKEIPKEDRWAWDPDKQKYVKFIYDGDTWTRV